MLVEKEKQKMHKNLPVIEIRLMELKSADDLYATYPLVRQLNRDLEEDAFKHIQDEMLQEGYACIGAFDKQNNLCGMIGYYISHRFYCGKSLRIDNIVVCRSMRNQGIGEALMHWIDDKAKQEGCCAMVLDAYVENKRSHDFYLKQGLSIVGLHFMKRYGEPK